MEPWLYHYLKFNLKFAKPFYKYHGYGVMNPMFVFHADIDKYAVTKVKG